MAQSPSWALPRANPPPVMNVNLSEREALLPSSSATSNPNDKLSTEKFAFNIALVRRIALIFKQFLVASPWHWLGIFSLILCSGLYSVVSSKIGDFYGDFYTVVTTPHDNLEAFRMVIYALGAAMVAQAVVQTCIVSSARALAVHVRRNITEKLHALYYKDRNYYQISRVKELQNPDQQLTQDIDRFARSYTDVLQKLTSSPVFIIFFWVRVSSMLHWTAPLVILAYYFVTYVIQRFVMSPIIHHVYVQERLEGEFRRVHATQNSFAEAIALYRGETVERRISAKTFEKVIDNSATIVKWEWLLFFMSYLFSYCGTLVGYIVVASPLIFFAEKALENNYVTTGLYDLGMLSWGFTQLTLVSTDLSEFSGYATRIALVLEKLLEFENKKNKNQSEGASELQDPEDIAVSFGGERVEIKSSSTPTVKCENVSVFSPLGDTLIKGANIELKENTLITGLAGSGKTSLLRVLAGLWPDFTGKVSFSEDVFVVPQDAYLPMASIRQQITYPKIYPESSGLVSLNTIHSLFGELGLEALFKRSDLDEIVDWSFLSPGQRQKLVMARVLFQKPKFAIFDEISSNVDIATEEKFYRLCQKSGITVLSIGHRESLANYHSQVLKLENSSLSLKSA